MTGCSSFSAILAAVFSILQTAHVEGGTKCYECYYYSGVNGSSGDASCSWGNIPDDDDEARHLVVDCDSKYGPRINDDDDEDYDESDRKADLPSHCAINDFEESGPWNDSIADSLTYGCITLYGEDHTNGETFTSRSCLITIGVKLKEQCSSMPKREWGALKESGLAQCVHRKFSGFSDQASLTSCNCKGDKCNLAAARRDSLPLPVTIVLACAVLLSNLVATVIMSEKF